MRGMYKTTAMENIINIAAITALVAQQMPGRHDVITALQNCSGGQWDGSGYYRFVSGRNANRPGADWQFKENILLIQNGKELIMLDVLQDGRIGGIEVVDLIT